MADDGDYGDEKGGQGRRAGTSPLLLALLLLNTLGLLGIGAYVVFVQPRGAPAAPTPEQLAAQTPSGAQGAPASAEGLPPGGMAGPMVDLGDLVVNLRDPGGDHFLKTRLSLELDAETTRAEVEGRLSQIRYQVNVLLSGQRVADVQGPEKMENLRQTMVRRVNAVLNRGRVVGVWPEVWIVQ